MTVITIRNVPVDVSEKLKRQAQLRGQSLQQFLLRELADIAERSPLEHQLNEVLGRLPHVNISREDVMQIMEEARQERDE